MQERRLAVLASYQQYVDALRLARLNPDHVGVRRARRALARTIERACVDDPELLSDFKKAFATHHRG